MGRFILSIASAILLTACATGSVFQDAPKPPPDKALVYLMRPVVGGGSFFDTKFVVDGRPVVSLLNNGYSWIFLDEGAHQIKAGDRLMTLDVRRSHVYYVEMRQGETVGWNTRQDWVREIPARTARPIIEKMRYTAAGEGTASETIQASPSSP